MKNDRLLLVLVIFLAIYAGTSFGQEPPKNPAKPQAANAGRVAGSYHDSFYLNLHESALDAVRTSTMSTLAGNALLTTEKNKEETFSIKKYKIEE
jgi:hypothetical protein